MMDCRQGGRTGVGPWVLNVLNACMHAAGGKRCGCIWRQSLLPLLFLQRSCSTHAAHAGMAAHTLISGLVSSSWLMPMARLRPRLLTMNGMLVPLPDPGAPFSQTTSRGHTKRCRQGSGAGGLGGWGTQPWAAKCQRSWHYLHFHPTLSLSPQSASQQQPQPSNQRTSLYFSSILFQLDSKMTWPYKLSRSLLTASGRSAPGGTTGAKAAACCASTAASVCAAAVAVCRAPELQLV